MSDAPAKDAIEEEAERKASASRWPPMSYWARATITVLLTWAALVAAVHVSNILIIVVIAFVIAVGLEPAVRRLERANMRRGMAVLVIFMLLLFVAFGFVMLVGPPLVHQISGLSADIPHYLDKLANRQDSVGQYIRDHNLVTKIKVFIDTLPAQIGRSFDTVLGLAGRVGSLVFNVVTVAILTVYFMLSLPSMRKTAALVFSPDRREQGRRVIDRSVSKIGGYVAGNLVTSAICSALALIVLLVGGVPFAVPLAAWAGVADLIPQVGSYLGAAPAIIVAFFASPVLGIIVLVYFIVYQQFENYYLVPRVMKDAVDLSPAAVIISTLVAGSLLGFAGALLALPIAATIKVVIYDVWLADRREQGDELVAEKLEEASRAEAEGILMAAARVRRRKNVFSKMFRRRDSTDDDASADGPGEDEGEPEA
jgi:predicted PurR-regulated permease PerM